MPSIRPYLTVVPPNSAVTTTAIDQAADPQLIHALEVMLAKAYAGEITGLMYVVRMNDIDHGICVTGAYKKAPLECLTTLDAFFTLLSRNSRLR